MGRRGFMRNPLAFRSGGFIKSREVDSAFHCHGTETRLPSDGYLQTRFGALLPPLRQVALSRECGGAGEVITSG